MRRLFRQFSFPGGIPSHVAPETPGSIHEGGELGYALAHAFGAAFDNPDLLVACVVGDGEAETGPAGDQLALQQVPQPGRATGRCCRSCTSTATRSPTPPCWPASPTTSWRACCRATATSRYFVEGEDPDEMHQRMAAVTRRGHRRDRRRSSTAPASRGRTSRPRWPMIVLRTPKGWTGPARSTG